MPKHKAHCILALANTFIVLSNTPKPLAMLFHIILSLFVASTPAREIVFPPVSGYSTHQAIIEGYNTPDISHSKFAGLTTYANLPYVHCLAPEEKM